MAETALDPDCARAVESLAAGLPEWHSPSVSGARRLERELARQIPREGVATRDLVDGPGGDLPLRRTGRPRTSSPRERLTTAINHMAR